MASDSPPWNLSGLNESTFKKRRDSRMKDTVLPTPFLAPALLRCSHYDGYTGEAARPESYAIRAVYEYELEYYIRSEGGIRVDGRYLPFSAGEINFRKPGQVVQGVPPMSVIFSLWIW